MTYLLRTRLTVEASSVDLETPELFANLIAAYTTVDILLEQADPSTLDSAYRFNAFCWRGRTLSLLNYADYMADDFLHRTNTTRQDRERVQTAVAERAHLIMALGDEGSESMLAPKWVHYKDAQDAHKAYLMWLQPCRYEHKFLSETPYLTPLVLPVPSGGLHLYGHH